MRSRSSVGNGRRWLVVGAAGVGGLVLLCLATLVIHRRAVEIPRVPVLVELFTSQGCASCPPADEFLITLDQEQFVPGALVIPLSEHVAYWNGRWRDPFSSSVFTERQRRYHDIRGSRVLFTPEMVVDGRRQFVGSQRMLAEHAIAHTAMMPKASITMAVGPSTTAERVHVNVEVSGISRATPRSDIDLWMAITEDGLETDVELGENARRRLRHAAVVRRLLSIATRQIPVPDHFAVSADLSIEAEWRRSSLRLVAFIQEQQSRHVLGVAQVPVG